MTWLRSVMLPEDLVATECLFLRAVNVITCLICSFRCVAFHMPRSFLLRLICFHDVVLSVCRDMCERNTYLSLSLLLQTLRSPIAEHRHTSNTILPEWKTSMNHATVLTRGLSAALRQSIALSRPPSVKRQIQTRTQHQSKPAYSTKTSRSKLPRTLKW